MAFDIFLSCLKDEGTGTFKRSLAQEIFGREAVKETNALFYVEYPDGGGSCVYCSEDEDLNHMMFNHAGGDSFFERLWELADRSHSMIFWPGDDTPVAVTSSEMLIYLPKEFRENVPPPFVVGNGKELADAIYSTS